jgi:hypothetical protein
LAKQNNNLYHPTLPVHSSYFAISTFCATMCFHLHHVYCSVSLIIIGYRGDIFCSHRWNVVTELCNTDLLPNGWQLYPCPCVTWELRGLFNYQLRIVISHVAVNNICKLRKYNSQIVRNKKMKTKVSFVWFVAFTATLHNEIFSGYQACQLVRRRKNQRFKDHLCPCPQGTDVSEEPVCVIYRPEFHVPDGALAIWSCWFVSRACCVRPASWLDSMLITGCQARLNMSRAWPCLLFSLMPIRLNNKNFNRDGGLMLSCAWHPVINMLSNQEAGLTQQALDTNQQLPLASALSWTWNSGLYMTWTGSPDTSVPWRRGQGWSLNCWFFPPFNQLAWLVAWENFLSC